MQASWHGCCPRIGTFNETTLHRGPTSSSLKTGSRRIETSTTTTERYDLNKAIQENTAFGEAKEAIAHEGI